MFITNVVRHRPPENRDPLPAEVSACDMWLRRHLAVLRPAVVVTLGRFAMYKFLAGESISRVHGRARRVDGLTVFPVFHPAAALHQPSLRVELEKDFAALAQLLAAARAAREAEAMRPSEQQMTLFG